MGSFSDMIGNMTAFTRAYADCEGMCKYKREALLHDLQSRYIMEAIREGDLLAGRKARYPLGFAPQSHYGSVGYYCSQPDLEELKGRPELSAEERQQIEDLQRFWQGKTTNEKIFVRYSESQKATLTHGTIGEDKGVCFPLYRMGGAQMDPTSLLEAGIDALIDRAKQSVSKNPAFFEGIAAVLASMQNVILRYRDEAFAQADTAAVQRAAELKLMAENFAHIAHKKPESFWQAMQLSYLFYQLSGSFNYGRMDEYLGSFYARDIDEGRITEEFAGRLTENLWRLICDDWNVWDGRVILGGADRRNIPEADRFALLAIDTTRRTRDVLPQLSLRCYQGMNRELYNRALCAIGEGTTYPILYNDDANIPAVAAAFRLDENSARRYVPFGCGEYVIYNQSFGTPSGAINLLHGLNELIYDGEEKQLETSPDFDSFYKAYLAHMQHYVKVLAEQEKLEYEVCAEEASFLHFSILFDDCMERGLPVFEGGVRYLGGTLETYGNTNTADSLTAIKRLVYEEKSIDPARLAAALKQDFTGEEALRAALLAAPKFGNDHPEADGMAARFHEDICTMVRDCAGQVGLHSYLPVVINNSMNTSFGSATGASADGRRAHTFLANANNPTGGMDTQGLTAMLNSLVKLRTDLHAGSVQNMRFSKEMFGEMRPKTEALLATYFAAGGAQTMITVLGREDLEQAMLHPERYANLIVRVGGFSARFVELSRPVQLELLSRTLY